MDRRTKRQKLQEMANQSVSPLEADIAREKLKSIPPDPEQQEYIATIEIVFNGVSGPGPDAMGVYDFTKGTWTWYSRKDTDT